MLVLSRLLNYPATVEVEVVEDSGAVLITLDGRNLGWGPIQERHLSGIVADLARRIEQEATPGAVLAQEAGPSTDPAEQSARPTEKPDHEADAGHPRRSWGDGSIFVSYRRDDTGYVTDAVCNRLAQAFGRAAIFKDVDSIPLGVNFRQYLTDAVHKCDVLLAVIGRDWLAPGSDGKTPRLHDDGDYVRIELEAALARGIPVIPVLVRVDKLPTAELLPESLREIVYFNGLPVRREPDFGGDLDRLRSSLLQILGPGIEPPPRT